MRAAQPSKLYPLAHGQISRRLIQQSRAGRHPKKKTPLKGPKYACRAMIEARFGRTPGSREGDLSLPARTLVRLVDHRNGRGSGKRLTSAFRESPRRLGKPLNATICRPPSSIKYHAHARRGELCGFALRPLSSTLKPGARQTLERVFRDRGRRMPER